MQHHYRLCIFINSTLLMMGTGASASPVQDQVPTLAVGMDAPRLEGVTWIQGEPTYPLDNTTITVVELWAIWCGPCVANMPHLSRLQAKWSKEKVQILSIAVNDEYRRVTDFAQRRSDVTHALGFDTKGTVRRNWMAANRRSGLPLAFVVDRRGRITYSGPAARLEEVVEAIMSENWDHEAAVNTDRKRIEKQLRISRIRQEAAVAGRAGNFARACELLDTILDMDPDNLSTIAEERLRNTLRLEASVEKACAFIEAKDAPFATDAGALFKMLSIVRTHWETREAGRDWNFELEITGRCVDITARQVHFFLDQHARALAATGDTDRAIKTLQEAIALVGENELNPTTGQNRKQEYETRLRTLVSEASP